MSPRGSKKPKKPKLRKPTRRESASDAKRLPPAAQSDDYDRKPTWSLALCDMDGPFEWTEADPCIVFTCLKEWEKLTLRDLLASPSKHHH